MGFDWQSFAQGFIERTQERRDTAEEEAKQYEQDQRNAAARNAQTISRRRAIVDQVSGIANQLRSQGVTDEQLQAIISSGPEAITVAADRVQRAVEANRGRPLGQDDITAILSMPEGFTPVDMSLKQFIDTTYGVTPTATQEAPAEEFTWRDRMVGRDQMSRANERLSNAPYAEGMSIAQINEMAMKADYSSLIPGSFVTYSDLNVFSPADQNSAFLLSVDRQLSAVETDINKIQSDYDNAFYEGDEAGMQDALQRRSQLVIDVVGPTIQDYVDTYGETFLLPNEQYLRRTLGDEYVDNLMINEGLMEPAEAGTTDSLLDTTTTPEPEIVTELPPIAEQTTTTQATVDESLRGSRQRRRFVDEQIDTTQPTTGENLRGSRRRRRSDDQGESELQGSVYDSLSEQGVDDISINLLQNRGTEILDALKGKDINSREELYLALQEWGQENGIIMPSNLDAMMYALSPYVLTEQ